MADTRTLNPRRIAIQRLRAQFEAQTETTRGLFEQAEAVIAADDAETPVWVTRQEAATYLRVSLRTVDNALADGRLPCRRIGTRVLIARPDLDLLGTRA